MQSTNGEISGDSVVWTRADGPTKSKKEASLTKEAGVSEHLRNHPKNVKDKGWQRAKQSNQRMSDST